jgi:hypothetical protein
MLKRLVRSAARIGRAGSFLPLGITVRAYGETDKWLHEYTDAYTTHLKEFRRRKNVLFEIGVGGDPRNYATPTPGGSLRVWRDYLPFSKIIGFDIEAKDVNLGRRVEFIRGDQTRVKDLEMAVTRLGIPDIVIDDGSHMIDHARISFDVLFPLMPSGGLYVIEDLHTSYSHGWGGDIPAPDGTAVGLTKDLVDMIQAHDITFRRFTFEPGRPPVSHGVNSMHVYPGITFIRKR